MPDIYGPQHKGDSNFAKRMRFHQSWYRVNVLDAKCGIGPHKNSPTKYGNMLDEEGAKKGKNFLSEQIHKAARARADENIGTVDKYRLFCNLLSSQPMCFNLFAPLDADKDLAARFLRKVVTVPVQKVTRVEIEFAPEPKKEYLDDRTAFDAFIEFETDEGKLGFVGIETKLTEPFSKKEPDTPLYRHWTEIDESPWPRESWGSLAKMHINQLWRDHLLAVAMIHHEKSPYSCGFLMLVRHLEDNDCSDTVEFYKKLLKADDDTFIDLPLNNLVKNISSVSEDEQTSIWLKKFHDRYLDMSLSEQDWNNRGVVLTTGIPKDGIRH